MKVITLTIILTFASLSLYSQNITNELGTGGVFTIKDGATNFFTLSQSTGNVSLSRSLVLPQTTGSAIGVIYLGTERFIHVYGSQNTFVGLSAGNFTMTGIYNTGMGRYSLNSNTTGSQNSALGYGSLNSNTTGNFNSAFGLLTLYTNTTGLSNSAFGDEALYSNTSGSRNSAFGYHSLDGNTTGVSNSAFGSLALYSSTTGSWNSAFGDEALNGNTTGTNNSAFGFQSLWKNITGYNNSAFGLQSLLANTVGSDNSAFGCSSLKFNISGFENIAYGSNSLYNNTNGSYNAALGYNTLYSNTTGFQNTGVGHHSLNSNTTGNYNTALGYNAGSTITTGANLTCIGIDAAPTSPTALDQITLGNGFVSSLRCNVTVITSLSDMRDKKNIKDLSLGLDFITKLKPRQFNWDKREWYEDNVSDGSKMKEAPTAGFIAQELDSAQTNANAEWLNLVLKDNPDKWEATPGNLFPIVVKAIQELKAENDGLKTENCELKERLSKIEQLQSMLAAEIVKLRSSEKETIIKVSETK